MSIGCGVSRRGAGATRSVQRDPKRRQVARDPRIKSADRSRQAVEVGSQASGGGGRLPDIARERAGLVLQRTDGADIRLEGKLLRNLRLDIAQPCSRTSLRRLSICCTVTAVLSRVLSREFRRPALSGASAKLLRHLARRRPRSGARGGAAVYGPRRKDACARSSTRWRAGRLLRSRARSRSGGL